MYLNIIEKILILFMFLTRMSNIFAVKTWGEKMVLKRQKQECIIKTLEAFEINISMSFFPKRL